MSEGVYPFFFKASSKRWSSCGSPVSTTIRRLPFESRTDVAPRQLPARSTSIFQVVLLITQILSSSTKRQFHFIRKCKWEGKTKRRGDSPSQWGKFGACSGRARGGAHPPNYAPALLGDHSAR